MSSASDSQNMSEGASYIGNEENYSSSSSERTVATDDRPIARLRKGTGGSTGPSKRAQPSRAVTVVEVSPEQAETIPTPATAILAYEPRISALQTGVVYRGPPSAEVQETFCTLSEVDLSRICDTYEINLDRFDPILPQADQIAYDPPAGYEVVHEEYFRSGFNLPVPVSLFRILQPYNLRLSQIKPNSLKIILCFFFFLRASEIPFDHRVFRSLFSCRSFDSWYHFTKRVPSNEFNFAINIPTFKKNWKGRFFYIKKLGLPKLDIWKSGKRTT